jgi:hypothetical protein
MLDDNFDTVQPPDPNIKMSHTMDRLFKTNNYKYNDPFGNKHTYLFSYWGVDIHPDNLSPDIKKCQESITTASTRDETDSITSDTSSDENPTNNRSIIGMNDLIILHANKIFPQNSKEDFIAYTHLHDIDVQIDSIPKPTKQKADDMGIFDLREEEFKLFAIEYNITDDKPNNDLDHYVNTLQHSNEDYSPGINDMFLNNLDPTCYVMQMKNPDVLTHAQMKRQVDADKFIEAQRPEIEGLMDIGTFKFIHKTKVPAKIRYLDLIWTYRRKRLPDGSLKKYKACI